LKFAAYGFCFAGDVRIKTLWGYKLMKDIKIGDRVLTLDKKSNKFIQTNVTNKFNNGIKKTYNIKTKNGKTIKGVTL
jgi:hypothetical protein